MGMDAGTLFKEPRSVMIAYHLLMQEYDSLGGHAPPATASGDTDSAGASFWTREGSARERSAGVAVAPPHPPSNPFVQDLPALLPALTANVRLPLAARMAGGRRRCYLLLLLRLLLRELHMLLLLPVAPLHALRPAEEVQLLAAALQWRVDLRLQASRAKQAVLRAIGSAALARW
jgi:hypothetical protein